MALTFNNKKREKKQSDSSFSLRRIHFNWILLPKYFIQFFLPINQGKVNRYLLIEVLNLGNSFVKAFLEAGIVCILKASILASSKLTTSA